MNTNDMITEFISQLQAAYPDVIIWTETAENEHNIYHDKRYSDPCNRVFYEEAGELYYSKFIDNGIENVNFVYKNPMSRILKTNQSQPLWSSQWIVSHIDSVQRFVGLGAKQTFSDVFFSASNADVSNKGVTTTISGSDTKSLKGKIYSKVNLSNLNNTTCGDENIVKAA